MEFKAISADLEDKGLNNCELEVLIPNNQNYKILAYQHKGDVEADNQEEMYVRHVDQSLATNKFNRFIRLASERDVELAISPEYSCPWASIGNAIGGNIFPNRGKIWVIGCESITPSELKDLIDQNTNDELYFIYDTAIVNSTEQKFVDPVCYFFRTNRTDNDLQVNVIAIQFKTFAMGAIPFERDGMLQGGYGYKFKNTTGNSINLITIICSESLDENLLDGLDLDESYLILHIQLNNRVRVYNFNKYIMDILYNEPKISTKDILILNWARNSRLSGNQMIYGGTTFYTKSTSIDDRDVTVNNNDSKGVFYSYWRSALVNTYFFDYDEYVFLFEADKASKRNLPIQNWAKSGLNAIGRYYWNQEEKNWRIQSATTCDLTKHCMEDDTCDFRLVIDLDGHSLNKERLIVLVNGYSDKDKWFAPNDLYTFEINDNQINRRLIFHHDPDRGSQNLKNDMIAKYGTLASELITERNNFPDRFRDLIGDCALIYNPDFGNEESYCINAQNSADSTATLIYLGDSSEIDAEERLSLIRNRFKDSQREKRILIWYRYKGLRQKFVPDDPNISENSSQSSISYKRTKE